MQEIEQKFAEADFDRLETELQRRGALAQGRQEERDQYFNAPDRDFVQTGEAFRLRSVGEKNYFTYKGPKARGPVKVRRELEPELADGPEAARDYAELLGALGFRYVATIRKGRTSYRLNWRGRDFTVCLDEVEGLGRYVEVEALADEGEVEAVAGDVQGLAGELGLSRLEPRSYLRLWLERHVEVKATQPVVVRTVEDLRRAIKEARRQGLTVGLVPTMGALHAGHRALMEASRGRDGFVVVSVFVNPAQFGPHEDLARYPRPFEADLAVCAEAGVDVVYQPSVEEMYPAGFQTWCEVTELQGVLEGAARPGHFRGVATVVLKLLNMVQPDRAYFGQKDAQQVRVIQQMVRDLNVAVDVVVCPTVREGDGLALSSRNVYLDGSQRSGAVVLSRALFEAEAAFQQGQRDAAVLKEQIKSRLESEAGAELDYVALVDAETLTPVDRATKPVLVALAVRFGSTRLIDNVLLVP